MRNDHWPQIDLQALQARHASQVRDLMHRLDLDHLLLTTFDHIRYTTGYRVNLLGEGYDWFAAVIDRDGRAEVFVPWVDESMELLPKEPSSVTAVHPVPSWAPAETHPQFWSDTVAKALTGARRVGVSLTGPSLLTGLQERIAGVDFVPIGRSLYQLRAVKDPDEIALLRAASVVNATAAEEALQAASAGMTDHDVLAVAMASLQRAGVEQLSHSLCNHRRGSGDWFPAGSVLREGDPFFFDIGCYGHGGYASDIARTGFVGQPRAQFRRAYELLLSAYELAQSLARPGVRVSTIHETVNDHLRSNGAPITPYGMGHGVGMRLCELPTIYRADRMDEDVVLEEGAVIALEPETAVEVDGELVVMKIEDNFVVRSDGVSLLSAPQMT